MEPIPATYDDDGKTYGVAIVGFSGAVAIVVRHDGAVKTLRLDLLKVTDPSGIGANRPMQPVSDGLLRAMTGVKTTSRGKGKRPNAPSDD